jgi:hypothetical protein
MLQTLDMLSSDTGIHFDDLHPGTFFRLDDSLFDRADGLINVGDYAATNSFRCHFSNPQDLDATVLIASSYHDANLSRPYIKGDDRFGLLNFSVSHEEKNLLV